MRGASAEELLSASPESAYKNDAERGRRRRRRSSRRTSRRRGRSFVRARGPEQGTPRSALRCRSRIACWPLPRRPTRPAPRRLLRTSRAKAGDAQERGRTSGERSRARGRGSAFMAGAISRAAGRRRGGAGRWAYSEDARASQRTARRRRAAYRSRRSTGPEDGTVPSRVRPPDHSKGDLAGEGASSSPSASPPQKPRRGGPPYPGALDSGGTKRVARGPTAR
jgi:hypothetical protein